MNAEIEKFNRINLEIATINPTITQLKNALNIASPRLKNLHDANFHIEAIILNGQIVEHTIKLILRAYQAKKNILNILGNINPLNEISFEKFEEDTLGNLIKTLTKCTGKTKLTESLWKFKNDYRDEFVHRIFDGSKDINQIEKEALTYSTSVEFQELVIGLKDAHSKVQEEVHELYTHD